MIIETSAIVLYSDMNPWINICVVPSPYEDFEKVRDIAEQAYDEWFEMDTDECIGEYIERMLDEEDCDYDIYYGDFNEDEEE